MDTARAVELALATPRVQPLYGRMAKGRSLTLGRVADRGQAAALQGAFSLLRLIGPVASSNLGGWIARHAGPHLGVSRVAEQNLRQAMPELDAATRAQIIRAVWDNLGRTVAELPHLPDFKRTTSGPGWELVGEAHAAALKQTGKPVLFFSGHFGNWEMLLPAAAQSGLPASGLYRAASNPAIDAVILAFRQAALGPAATLFAKGAGGARASLAHLARGGSLGLLIDQKMNDGIPVPFFGRPAMTAPALAQFALRFRLPLVPAHVQRIGPARFRVICEAPLAVPLTGDRMQDIYAIMLAVNATLERWVRADPASWLWLHRRWPKEPGRSVLPASSACPSPASPAANTHAGAERR